MQSEQIFASGRKVNVNQNFAVGDKVKMVNRLMNRIMSALGSSEGSQGYVPANSLNEVADCEGSENAPAISLFGLMSVYKRLKPTSGGGGSSRASTCSS